MVSTGINELKIFIEKYTNVLGNEWYIKNEAFERKTFVRNKLILSEGSVCKYFYFLEQGLVRFFINQEGNEITKFFTAVPYCLTSKESFRNQAPATENIQALADTVIWQITLDQSDRLLELKSWNIFTRKFIYEVQNYTEALLLENKIKSVEKLYWNLMETHPDVIQRIPLKYLVSFLGIAPQSLSRIRKKINKKL